MTDDEFERERARIEAIHDPTDLADRIHVFQRRQLDSAAHAALIGFAVIRAIEKEWVPKGRAEFAAHCKKEWGYSVSQINSFRRLAKDWKVTLRAQELLLANRDKLSEDVKLPEVGSTAFADKAIKYAEASDKAVASGLDEDEAMATAEQKLRLTPKKPSGDIPVGTRYTRLLSIFAIAMHQRPDLEDEVLHRLVPSIDLESMDSLDRWLKRELIGDRLDEFHTEQHEWHLSELDPPWEGDEEDIPKPPRKRAQRPPNHQPKQAPETGTHNDTDTDEPKRRPGRPKKATNAPKRRTKAEVQRDQNRAYALRIARDLPGNWPDVSSRIKGDVVRQGWVQMVMVTDGKTRQVPEITEAGLEQLARYEADGEPEPEPEPDPPEREPPPQPEPDLPPIDPAPTPDPPAIDPDPEPEPPPKNLSQAVMNIWTMKDDRTCDNVAAILGRFPIETWNEDNRDRLAEELWNACDPAVWSGDNEDRQSLVELYFEHDPATKLFADELGVLTVDEKLGLQIVRWQEIWQMMAPHIEDRRKRDEKRQRGDEGNAILASKLPAKRKLRAMHERIGRLLELKLHIPDELRVGIDRILAMTTDNPAFADCVTVLTYIQRTGLKNGGS